MASKLGWSYSDFLAAIISTAQHRALERPTTTGMQKLNEKDSH